MDRAVVFIDLLGFRNLLTKDNIQTAISLFENYNSVIVGNPTYLNTGFESFLPMSDSIIMTTRDPNDLIPILSNFLIECFLFTSGAYSNVQPGQNPTVLNIPIVTPNGVVENEEKWPPTLFRGGFSFGETVLTTQQAVERGTNTTRTNVAGIGYLSAVQLEERKIKGPRILVDRSVIEQLTDDTKKYLFKSDIERSTELLWPAFQYNETIDPNIELNEFVNLFIPAVALYRFFEKASFGAHYLEFLKLIVRSALRFFEDKSNFVHAKEHICNQIKQNGLERELLEIVKEWPSKASYEEIVAGRLKLWWSRTCARLKMSFEELDGIFRR